MKSQSRDRRTGGKVSKGRIGRSCGAVLALAVIVAIASPAVADDYDSSDAGNPVRIAAYVLYPVGVLLDYLLLRPAHWLVSHEPLKTVFGHED